MLIKAHAKINLTLDVCGIRKDGYHDLISVMQSLALHDVLELTPAENIELSVTGAVLPEGPGNLVYTAAEKLRQKVGYSSGARIKLVKRIPVAAGMAGGSSDAAAVLRGLNQLWKLGLNNEDLMNLAAKVGSDVPYCLYGGTALVKGRGEFVEPLLDLPALGVLLVKPPFGVGTAEVYHKYDLLSKPPESHSQGLIDAINRGDYVKVPRLLGNDLEAVTISMHPIIESIKKDISAAGALGVLMSGSGPTVFGLFTDYKDALAAAQAFTKRENWVCATVFSARVSG